MQLHRGTRVPLHYSEIKTQIICPSLFQHEKAAVTSSARRHRGSVTQSANHQRPVFEGSKQVNSYCLCGLTGPNKDMPTVRGNMQCSGPESGEANHKADASL